MIKKAALMLLAVLMLAGCNVQKNPDTDKTAPPVQTDAAPVQTESAIPSKTEWTKPEETQALSPEDQRIADYMIELPSQDITMEKADGTKVMLSSLKGKPVVLNFWATWCPYCIAEFGYFAQAQKDFPGIAFYAVDTWEKKDISVQANREEIEKFAKEKGFELPVLFDAGNKAANSVFGFQGIPVTILIDSKGNIRWYMPGAFASYDQLKKYLTALMKADM